MMIAMFISQLLEKFKSLPATMAVNNTDYITPLSTQGGAVHIHHYTDRNMIDLINASTDFYMRDVNLLCHK